MSARSTPAAWIELAERQPARVLQQIVTTLEATAWDVGEAAQLLGVPERILVIALCTIASAKVATKT